jgi:hypothetical protein
MELSVQLHAPAALPPGKESPIPMDIRIGGPQSRSGHSGGEEKRIPASAGIRTTAIHPVAQSLNGKSRASVRILALNSVASATSAVAILFRIRRYSLAACGAHLLREMISVAKMRTEIRTPAASSQIANTTVSVPTRRNSVFTEHGGFDGRQCVFM